MRKFITMGRMEFKTSIAYKLNFMSSIIISPLMLMLYYFIWSSVYSNNAGDILGYSFEDMITYYVFIMITGHFIYNRVGHKLQQKVLYGELTQDLLRPYPVFFQFLSRELADRIFAFFVEVIPVFIISLIIFNINSFQGSILFFFIALIFAFLINFMLGFITGTLAFWVKKIESFQWLMYIFMRFLSGEFIPLDFFGTYLLNVSKFLPFYYLRYGVVKLVIEKVSFFEGARFIGIQIIWILILIAVYKLLWAKALKKFGAEGG
ncbi:hypothetical protein GF327_08290 [Candidatus Woesearchaeota archaeon]|nr:hypothetical protein [Candidatus Woesearchaeota archaeon]